MSSSEDEELAHSSVVASLSVSDKVITSTTRLPVLLLEDPKSAFLPAVFFEELEPVEP